MELPSAELEVKAAEVGVKLPEGHLPKAEDQVEPPQEWDLGMWPGGANVRPPTLVLPSS